MDDQVSPSEDGARFLSAVPLFPLPNVVLFPRAVLPLHIFEERYRQMVGDALLGSRQIAMALLWRGWEKEYHARPRIEPVVCVGTIVSHEQLPDGKYNLLLQGMLRAQVLGEYPVDDRRLYRTARLEVVQEIPALEIDLGAQRERLVELFTTREFSSTGLAKQFRHLLSGPWPTTDVIDLIAFTYFEDVPLKQELLAEPDVRRRVDKAMSELERLRLRVRPASSSLHPPSMN